MLAQLAPVLCPQEANDAGKRLFRFVAQEVREMDLSHGWLVLAPSIVRWCPTAEAVVEALRGLVAATVLCLGETAQEAAA